VGDSLLTWEPPRTDVARLYVVGFDPGGTTGWAALRLELEALSDGVTALALSSALDVFAWCTGEFVGPENHQVDMMMELLRDVWREGEWEEGADSDVFAVAVEDFILRILQQDRALLSPVRITAAFNYAGRDLPMPRTLQAVGDAKKVMTDERLRKLNMYEAGVGDHRRDALRHALLLARKLTDPRVMAAWRVGCAWLRVAAQA
jgi:hypothetical protein